MKLLVESNVPHNSVGYFGEVLEVLHALLNSKHALGRYDEEMGVWWGPGSTFFDADYGENAWEYYFTPLFNREVVHSTVKSPSFVGFYPRPGAATWGPFSVHRDGGQRLRAAVQVGREVMGPGLIFDIREDLKLQLAAYSRVLLADRPHLGVHRRTTDWHHGPTLPIEQVFAAVDPHVDAGYDVLLVTDSEQPVQQFYGRYGADRVKTTDACRGVDETTKMPHTGVRCGSPARHGYEVLQDAYVLSRCEKRLATSSNLTSFVEILNPWQELDESLYPTVWGVEFESGVHGPLRREKPPGWPNTSGW